MSSISDFFLAYTGPYLILITPGVRYKFGDYTLKITCGTTNTNCTPTSDTVCVLNGRFRVSVDYRNQFANPPQPGTFTAARLNPAATSPDTATFGFGNAQALVVRIVDARPFAPRYDVYYGGLTDVEYTDTATGKSMKYRNPPGTVGGSVDRRVVPAQ